jgi:hypothetical protein
MLSGGRVRMRKSTYLPGTDRSEMIELRAFCYGMPRVTCCLTPAAIPQLPKIRNRAGAGCRNSVVSQFEIQGLTL